MSACLRRPSLDPGATPEHAPSCPACGAANVTAAGPIAGSRWFAGQQLETTLPGGCLYLCQACELGFRHPRPPKAWLDQHYRAATADNWQESDAGSRRDWSIARSWIADRSGGSRIDVLDVGCSGGGFLQGLGSNVVPYGIEANRSAAGLAAHRGVRILGDDFAALDRFHASFETVVAIDVVEHVDNPLRLLDRLGRAVRPGGTVIISTGNLHAPSWRMLGSRYWYCTIPEHVCFIHPDWCEWAAARVGLRLERIEHFAHDSTAGPLRRLDELTRNLAFRLAPRLFAWMRRQGVGGVDVRGDESLAATPPMWLTARDHFIARFRKA